MKKAQHGGKRERAGRKPKPEGQKPKISITLSREAIASLDRIATHLSLSRSEVVERIARGDEEIMGLLSERAE
jgi:chorismate mutase